MDYNGKGHQPARCLQCGEEISYGRSDKKFCCEACKNRYHNRKMNALRAFRSRVTGKLEKNHEVLEAILCSGQDGMELMQAESLGFSPSFVTSFKKVRSKIELGCYDILYRMSEDKISSVHKIPDLSVNLQENHKKNDEDE